MRQQIAPLFVLAATTLISACAANPESMPSAPSALSSTATDATDAIRGTAVLDRLADRPDHVSLRGRIRDLNDRKTQFTLVLPLEDGQTEPRSVLVRLDERTKIFVGDRPARRSVLQNGLECGVDGILRSDSHVLAVKITIPRPNRD